MNGEAVLQPRLLAQCATGAAVTGYALTYAEEAGAFQSSTSLLIDCPREFSFVSLFPQHRHNSSTGSAWRYKDDPFRW
jgi:hypothetical protein